MQIGGVERKRLKCRKFLERSHHDKSQQYCENSPFFTPLFTFFSPLRRGFTRGSGTKSFRVKNCQPLVVDRAYVFIGPVFVLGNNVHYLCLSSEGVTIRFISINA